jgi:hypothetical protein
MYANQATQPVASAATHRNPCLLGTSLTEALSLAAELAQWAEDVLGAPGPLREAAAMVFDVYACDQTRTKGPLDVSHAQLLADGHDMSAEAWNAVRPLFIAARRELGEQWDAEGDEDGQRGEWRDLPAVGEAVAL